MSSPAGHSGPSGATFFAEGGRNSYFSHSSDTKKAEVTNQVTVAVRLHCRLRIGPSVWLIHPMLMLSTHTARTHCTLSCFTPQFHFAI